MRCSLRIYEMRNLLLYIFTIFFLSISFIPLFADNGSRENWSDLDEGEHKIFGSEKEEKYSINAFIIEKEEWGNHYSFMFLWLFKKTDYPKYSSLRILPFWYRLNSKIDNRKKTIIPILLYYNRIEGHTDLTITPLFYSNLQRDESDRSILYLIWWGTETGYYNSSYFFSPIFYRSEYEKRDSVERGSRWINLLFYSDSSTYRYGKRTVSEKTNFSLLHYYSSTTRGNDRELERTWWFPILPLTYHHTSPEGGHRNILWLIDYSWGKGDGTENMERFWFIPFWFWKHGSDGYNLIVPPVYIKDRGIKGDYYEHLLPIFIKRRSIAIKYSASEKGWVNEYRDLFISPIYCSSKHYRGDKKWEGEPIESSYWWGPIIPLYYSHRDRAGGIHKNILLLYDTYENSKAEVMRRWIIPFYFSKRDSYKHIFPPLYMSWRDEGEETFLGPIYYHNSTESSSSNLIGPLWWSRDKERGERSFHLIPFYFRWSDNYEKTVLGPIYYRHTTPGSSSTLIFILWRYSDWENDSSSLHAFPFYFSWEDRSAAGYSKSRLVPLLWYSSYSEYPSGRESTVINPLWYYSSDIGYSEDKSDVDNGTRLWIPLLPILYSSYTTSESAHRTILLCDWKRDADGELERFWFIPLIFHRSGESGYRYYIPFYFRPSGWTGKRGVSFGPFHYHKWSPEEEVKWSWLIHYYRGTPSKGEEINHWMPIYFSWQYRKWNSTLFLPWKFEYNDRKRNLYINILGISKSIASGPNPNVSIGIGKKESGWYLDTEISWLYDMLSFSTRVTLKKPWENVEIESDTNENLDIEDSGIDDDGAIAEKEINNDNEQRGVSLRRKKEFTREDSVYFWGWKILFGLTAYERADGKRHFRLLPLWWLTWDETSNNEIKWILLYLSYRSEDEEYLVFFPLYGRQAIGSSYKKGYLLILYWDEYDSKEELREHTLLWPFVNWYDSPEQSGWRVLPFIWHKEYNEDGVHTSRTVSLLYFSKERTRIGDSSTLYYFSISPFHYYREKSNNKNFEKKWFFPILPIVYYSEERTTCRSEIPIIPVKDDDETRLQAEKSFIIIEGSSFIIPLYYWTETETEYGEEIEEPPKREFTLYGLPLLYYHKRDITERWRGNSNKGVHSVETTFFLLGYYSYRSSALNWTSFLFGLYKNTQYPDKGFSEFRLLYGLFKVSGSEEQSESHFIPFYSYYNSPERWELSILFGLYKDTDYLQRGEYRFKLLYGLYYESLEYRKEHIEADKDHAYTACNTGVRTTWVFPLYYHNKHESADKDFHYNETTHIFWLWYKHHRSTVESDSKHESTLWFPIIPLFYRHVTPDRKHYNILWIFDWEKDDRLKYERTWVLPFYLKRTGEEGYRYIFPLFYSSWDKNSERSLNLLWWSSRDYAKKEESNHLLPFYFSWESPKEESKFILGLYLYNSPQYRRQNFLYIFDHREYLEREFDRYSYLFGFVDYQVSPEIKSFRLFFGILSSYTSYRNSNDYEFNVLWVLSTWQRRGAYYQNSILPFWYYRSDDTGWSFLSPVGLTYLSKDDTGDFDMGLLGLVYYRNNNIPEKRDRRMWLMGVLWNEVQRPERGYSSIGQLWGLLWEHEREKETNFSKFSILKFVYKRVDMNGSVYYKIFGFKL